MEQELRERQLDCLMDLAHKLLDTNLIHMNRKLVPNVRAMINLVNFNLSDPQLSLKMIADHLGVNNSHLSQQFNREVGCSLPEYVAEKRIELARQLVGVLLKNRALLGIIGAALSMLLAQLLTQAMNIYLFADYFKSAALMSLTALASFIPMLIMAPIASRLSRRFGKKECSIVGVAVAFVFSALLFVLHVSNPMVYIVLTLCASIGIGFFNMVIWAFITDIIDYQEVKTGSRDDGTVYAIYSFSRKAGQALAGGIGGVALGAVGYVSSTAGSAPVEQSQQTLDGIYNICTGAPAIAYLVVLLLLVFVYPLGKKEVEKNVAILKERREAAEQE